MSFEVLREKKPSCSLIAMGLIVFFSVLLLGMAVAFVFLLVSGRGNDYLLGTLLAFEFLVAGVILVLYAKSFSVFRKVAEDREERAVMVEGGSENREEQEGHHSPAGDPRHPSGGRRGRFRLVAVAGEGPVSLQERRRVRGDRVFGRQACVCPGKSGGRPSAGVVLSGRRCGTRLSTGQIEEPGESRAVDPPERGRIQSADPDRT